MPWDTDSVWRVTGSETAMTAEWRARQESRGQRRQRPQPRHIPPAQEATPGGPPDAAEPAPPEHQLDVLA